MADSNEWIRNRAYALWEEEGRPHGRDAEHWARACEEFEAQSEATEKPAAAVTASRTRKAASPATEAPVSTAEPKKPKASAKTKTATAKAPAKPVAEPKPVEPIAAPARKRSAKTPVA
ncbi:DUF2934 domain-containing protein [Rhizobium sp. CSW-27]|uniref:DUF2934 domain-containing protein n=1 Tax=Rhizobium sp. CSW-27 TaxID=2839985 RepID=UPI001C01C4DE|nr:DUF2934 domain-containing protein [Rhizobium sp. CSW-27]MBT9369110.1 DUF2934 domain-containing protein [Rhizobium sp. CSW-27]